MRRKKWSKEEITEYRITKRRIFYFNTKDSNLFVPKGYGYGITFNWANPLVWVVIVILIGYIIWLSGK